MTCENLTDQYDTSMGQRENLSLGLGGGGGWGHWTKMPTL